MQPQLWVPPDLGGSESWDQFRIRVENDFNQQLSNYREQVAKYYGLRKDNERDALWTARFQKSISIIKIAKDLPRAYKDPDQTVKKAIGRFAISIGLTLRSHR